MTARLKYIFFIIMALLASLASTQCVCVEEGEGGGHGADEHARNSRNQARVANRNTVAALNAARAPPPGVERSR